MWRCANFLVPSLRLFGVLLLCSYGLPQSLRYYDLPRGGDCRVHLACAVLREFRPEFFSSQGVSSF